VARQRRLVLLRVMIGGVFIGNYRCGPDDFSQITLCLLSSCNRSMSWRHTVALRFTSPPARPARRRSGTWSATATRMASPLEERGRPIHKSAICSPLGAQILCPGTHIPCDGARISRSCSKPGDHRRPALPGPTCLQRRAARALILQRRRIPPLFASQSLSPEKTLNSAAGCAQAASRWSGS